MTRQGFGWDGALYQDNSAVQFDLGMRAIDKLELNGDEKILDIGCGNAMITIELAKKIPTGSITSIELSKDMLNEAKKNLRDHNITNVELVNMNANDINYRDLYDVVFANSAIHYVKDLDLTYKAIYKSLKMNGQIMIQTLLKEMGQVMLAIAEIIKLVDFKDLFKGFQMPWNYLSIKRTKKMLQMINYKEIVIEEYRPDFKFERELELTNFLKAAPLVPLLEKVPEHLKDCFVDKYMELYLERVGENNFIVNLPRIFISAKKL